jgi:hypothetical protein
MREYDLALEVLDLEVQLHQEEIIFFELEDLGYVQRRKSYISDAEKARIACLDFVSDIQEEGRHRTEAKITEGFSYLLLAKTFAEKPNLASFQTELEEYARHAERIFSDLNCSLGLAQVQLLRLAANIGPKETGNDWTSILAVFVRHGYLNGIHKLEIDMAARSSGNSDVRIVSPSPTHYEKLLPIVKSTGNELLYRLYVLRSMPSWTQGLTFIRICERIYHPVEGFLSDELCIEASRLLSQLYRLNNNFSEASAYALLYLKYAHGRDDPRMLDHSSMNYLQSVGNLANATSGDDCIYELLNLSVSFDRMLYRLCQSTLTALDDPAAIITYSDLPIESLLWLAKSVRVATDEDCIQSMLSQLIRTLYRTLQLSVDLLCLLPMNYRRLFECRVCAALGTAAEVCANPALSLLCYDLGHERAFGVDGFEHSFLKLQVGRRLTSWIYHDRPKFLMFQEIAWAYLCSAEQVFWAGGTHLLSYQNGLETSMVLSRSYLREVQFLIGNVDWGEDEDQEALTPAQVVAKNKIKDLIEEGLTSIRKAFTGKYEYIIYSKESQLTES